MIYKLLLTLLATIEKLSPECPKVTILDYINRISFEPFACCHFCACGNDSDSKVIRNRFILLVQKLYLTWKTGVVMM
jgi:hypothetical protein